VEPPFFLFGPLRADSASQGGGTLAEKTDSALTCAGVAADPDRALSEAERLEAAGRLEEAAEIYRELLRLFPDNGHLLHNFGLVLRAQTRLSEAESTLRKALTMAPDEASFHNSLGVVLQDQGHDVQAEACYRAALALRPDDPDAHYNLGLLLEESDRSIEARAVYEAAVAAAPRFARALTRIGVILSRQGASSEALEYFDRAVANGPHYFEALYHRGDLLSKLGRPKEALLTLERAASLRPDSLEAVLAVANALRDAGRLDQAISAYWQAMELQPQRSSTHEEINRLVWVSGRHDLYLQSFSYARQHVGLHPDLLVLEAGFRLRRDEFLPAEELLRSARAQAPERGDVMRLLARSLAGQGRFEEAYAFFSRAIAAEPDVVLHHLEYGLALLRGKEAREALAVFETALALSPNDQLLLAGLSAALRELDDGRYHLLVDPSRYVRSYDIQLPSGFKDARAFNLALAEELDALHTARVEPIDQTLRRGTQTMGHLFAADTIHIQQVKEAIAEAVADYIRQLPDTAVHPTNARKSADFEFSGSWSCRLGSDGFHTNHVHPQGWISSAYYVRLPDGLGDAQQRPGWLKFEETNMALGRRDRPAFFIKPQVGRLVLFPSFYWHGTVPFSDEHDRLTIAFDVVPRSAPGSRK
jgi:uncharacterized protein (TIGR02466 family)